MKSDKIDCNSEQKNVENDNLPFQTELFSILDQYATGKQSQVELADIKPRKDADEKIDDINQCYVKQYEADAESKRRMRKNVLTALFWFLAIQTVFLNIVIATVLQKCFSVNAEQELIIQEWSMSLIVGMIKWYTSAVLVELLGAFIFIIKVVFETPKKPNK